MIDKILEWYDGLCSDHRFFAFCLFVLIPAYVLLPIYSGLSILYVSFVVGIAFVNRKTKKRIDVDDSTN